MGDTLFTVKPKLTERQQTAYDYVAANQPVLARDLGYHLHERRGCRFCRYGFGCRYAASEGMGVLKALKAKGLLRSRRNGWFVAGQAAPSAQGGEIPF